MGTFIGHLVPGLAITLLGLWHTINTTKLHKLQGPSNFITPTWFPFPKIKHLELYLILSFSLLTAGFQFSGPRLPGLEHATMFLHLAIYAIAALVYDRSPNQNSSSTSALIAILAASAFGQELFLLNFHSTDHIGLEGHYHYLLQIIVAASFTSMIVVVLVPSSFVAATVRSAAVTCQGVWLVVMGFMLWVPRFVPDGCYPNGVDGRGGAVECGTEEAGRRAAAAANLLFSWMVAAVLVVMVGVNLLEEGRWSEYRQLQLCRGVDDGGGGKQGHGNVCDA